MDRNTQQQFNICASGFVLYQILIRYWGCQPCGEAVGASPEGRGTLHSCCQWTVETRRNWSWWWRSSNRGPQRCHQEGMNLQTAWSIRFNWFHHRRVMLIKAQCGHDCICTFKVLSGGISRGAGSQTGSLWTGLRTQEWNVSHMQTPTFLKFLHLKDCFFFPPLPAVMDWTERSLYASGCPPDRPWAKGWAGWSGSRWRTAAGQRRSHQPRAGQEQPVEGRAWRVRLRPCCCIVQKLWPHPGGWVQRTCTGILDRKMKDLIGQ